MAEIPKVAIILPVYNESQLIGHALASLGKLKPDELIVVDGGSRDGTLDVIRRDFPSCHLIQSPIRQRSSQMNLGARTATSDILVFVHVDIELPPDALSQIRGLEPGKVGGGFCKRYDPTTYLLNAYVALLNVIYLQLLKRLVGTNAIFVRRDIFNRLGGFPEVSFLEDVMFSAKLKREGRLAFLRPGVKVSSRRYLRRGFIKQIMRNAKILYDFNVRGRKPQELIKEYEEVK